VLIKKNAQRQRRGGSSDPGFRLLGGWIDAKLDLGEPRASDAACLV
jgi:hypothetical protein